MNPHFRHGALSMNFDEWPENLARKAAEFHSRRAEHHLDEHRQERADRHRDVAEVYVKSAFSFERARRSADDGLTEHARDHLRRGQDHMRNASDLAHTHGLEQPLNIDSILGVVRGEGSKIGAN